MLKKAGARIGAIIGSIFGKTAEAAAAVFDGRKAKDAAKAKALQAALEAAKNESIRRLDAEQVAKSAVWERDAIKEVVSKSQREAEAERVRLVEVIEALQPVRSPKQSSPTTRPRL